MAEKICVGMSGGVDSSVAAYILKKQGYEVVGVSLELHCHNLSDNSESEISEARRVADFLGIEHKVVDYKALFEEYIEKYFVDEYTKGRTPNPCIMCNPLIKWKALLKLADEIGAKYVATGHYAHIALLENGRYSIKMADSKAKDQTYALNRLTQEMLMRTKMPLGAYSKDEIRQMASDIGLSIARKPDSQDICFIPDGDYVAFVEKKLGKKFPKGDFIDKDENVLGEHSGIINYTIGQRKGLGIAFGKPAFVTAINPKTNQVVIGDNEDCFKKSLTAIDVNYMGIEDIHEEIRCKGKIRYAHKESPCTIKKLSEDMIQCVFDEPQRAITPGQSVVFYDNEYIIASGIIL